MQPSSTIRSPRPGLRPVVSVSSTTLRIGGPASPGRNPRPCGWEERPGGNKSKVSQIPRLYAPPVPGDVSGDQPAGDPAPERAFGVEEPQPHQADHETAGLERSHRRSQSGPQLSGAPCPAVSMRRLVHKLR